jgi:hypothetical protein
MCSAKVIPKLQDVQHDSVFILLQLSQGGVRLSCDGYASS